ERYGTEYFALYVSEHLDLLRKTGFETAEIFWHSYMQSGFYAVKPNYYISGNAKVYYEYGEDGYMLLSVVGKTDNFMIPDTINSIDVTYMDSDYMREEGDFSRITLSENNKYFLLKDDVLFSRDRKKLFIYNRKEHDSYIIPSGVEEIEPSAFSGFGLKSIVISEGVKRIYQYAFACCKNVERIYLPSSLEMVSLKTFYFFGNGNLKVFYGGTPEQWQKIDFAFGNFEVINLYIHCNSPVPDIDENGNIIFKERD
ncbi:MAG: leucine-rich repeat domain-containing protein, partial [Ruminococcus sp.]|nr:leucine-rich repeat domain-containing protein [Ruminococcus sp.]